MLTSPTNIRQRRQTRRRRASSCSSVNSTSPSTATSFQFYPPKNAHEHSKRATSPHNRRWKRSSTSPRELAGLKYLVLSHIDELEKKLEQLEPIPDFKTASKPSAVASDKLLTGQGETTLPVPSFQQSTPSDQTRLSPDDSEELPPWSSEFDFTVDDLRTWVEDSLEQLAHLRAEVSARLPDLEELRAQFRDIDFDFELPNLNLDEFRARLSRIEVPSLGELSSLSVSDVKNRLGDLGYEYLPTLSERLSRLNSHLTSLRTPHLPSRTLDKGHAVLKDFIEALMYDEEDSPMERERVEVEIEQMVIQVRQALRDSENGNVLLTYEQLPIKWRNNEHVLYGYRFIPIERWPTLLLSAFQFHNETLNIHTHFLPFAVLGPWFAYEAYTATSQLHALPTTLFGLFASLCLLTSCIWHLCAGCSTFKVMETAARVDYLGIGWLISASIATVVYYGFSCRQAAFSIYLSMTILAGLAGSILPFMQWFNERKHKKWRIVFFLSLALTGIIPIVHMCSLHSAKETFSYILPIVPSLASYIFGLVFYASHFPECCWSTPEGTGPIQYHKVESSSTISDWAKDLIIEAPPRWTDWIGGGSHAIWHVSIVAAIWLHRSAIPTLSKGLGGECCDVWA